MKDLLKNKFQLAILGVFVFFIILAVVLFSATGKKQSTDGTGPGSSSVVLWGTIPSNVITPLISQFNIDNVGLNVSYKMIPESIFDSELTEALASGNGPDAIIAPHPTVLRQAGRTIIIPYTSLSERDYKNIFIDGAQYFLTPNGILGYPILVDPMVMYFNRDHLSNNFLVNPPRYWKDMSEFVRTVKRLNPANIEQAAVALGTTNNINYFEDILALLIMQAGNPLVGFDEGGLVSTLNQSIGVVQPVASAVQFFTSFADPSKDVYTWNTSLRSSRDAFLAGNVSLYFGYASELEQLRQLNPNLNFDATFMPQIENSPNTVTSGSLVGFAVLKSSTQQSLAFQVGTALVSPTYQKILSETTLLPPTRRDLLEQLPGDSFRDLFYRSAIVSRSWYMPSRADAQRILGGMIESYRSGRLLLGESVNNASTDLDLALSDIKVFQAPKQTN
ncbi:MAG: extracellular solute-binding protein [Candidatus Nomurabacteria bacterium]|nr:extracellular solute-binding protein [Candidatus Nomurabacteria bacterium]